ncbi:MAG: hypothetical protein ACQEW8_07480 [Actinomycetota bacterium]
MGQDEESGRRDDRHEAGYALATTGANSDALLTLWIGGGALVLAGGGVAVASAVRRNRNQATAA